MDVEFPDDVMLAAGDAAMERLSQQEKNSQNGKNGKHFSYLISHSVDLSFLFMPKYWNMLCHQYQGDKTMVEQTKQYSLQYNTTKHIYGYFIQLVNTLHVYSQVLIILSI